MTTSQPIRATMTSRSSAANTWLRRTARAFRSRGAFGYTAAASGIKCIDIVREIRPTALQRSLVAMMTGHAMPETIREKCRVVRCVIARTHRFERYIARGLAS